VVGNRTLQARQTVFQPNGEAEQLVVPPPGDCLAFRRALAMTEAIIEETPGAAPFVDQGAEPGDKGVDLFQIVRPANSPSRKTLASSRALAICRSIGWAPRKRVGMEENPKRFLTEPRTTRSAMACTREGASGPSAFRTCAATVSGVSRVRSEAWS